MGYGWGQGSLPFGSFTISSTLQILETKVEIQFNVCGLINLKPLRDPVGSQINLDALRIFLSSSKGKCSRSSPLVGDDLHFCLGVKTWWRRRREPHQQTLELAQTSSSVRILTQLLQDGEQLLWPPRVVWLLAVRGSDKSWPQYQLSLCKSLKHPVPQFPY